MTDTSIARVLLQVRVGAQLRRWQRVQISERFRRLSALHVPLPCPQAARREVVEADEIRAPMAFPEQLARALVANEIERELCVGDVAARVAVGSRAKRVHVS